MSNFDHLKARLENVTTEPTASSFEETFNLPAGSTPSFEDSLPVVTVGELVDPATGEITVRPVDEVTPEIVQKEERIEELQIAANLENIYNSANQAFKNHITLATDSDPKFAARNGEVAAQFLTIALQSVTTKVDAKFKRAKMRYAEHAAANPSTTNQLIYADRNDVLAALFNKDKNFDAQSIIQTIDNDIKK